MTVYIVKVSQITYTFATHKYNWIKKHQIFVMYVPDLYVFSFLTNCCVPFVWCWLLLKMHSQICTVCIFYL